MQSLPYWTNGREDIFLRYIPYYMSDRDPGYSTANVANKLIEREKHAIQFYKETHPLVDKTVVDEMFSDYSRKNAIWRRRHFLAAFNLDAEDWSLGSWNDYLARMRTITLQDVPEIDPNTFRQLDPRGRRLPPSPARSYHEDPTEPSLDSVYDQTEEEKENSVISIEDTFSVALRRRNRVLPNDRYTYEEEEGSNFDDFLEGDVPRNIPDQMDRLFTYGGVQAYPGLEDQQFSLKFSDRAHGLIDEEFFLNESQIDSLLTERRSQEPGFWDKLAARRRETSVIGDEPTLAFLNYLAAYANQDILNNSQRFLGVLSYFITTEDEPRETLSLGTTLTQRDISLTLGLDQFDWYSLFRFFGASSNEIVASPESAQLKGRDLQLWAKSVEKGFELNRNQFIPEIAKNVLSEQDIILRRCSASQILFAIETTSKEVAERTNIPLNEQEVYSLLFDARFHVEAQDRINLFKVWDYLIALLMAMRFVWSNSLCIPDLLLKQINYSKVALDDIQNHIRITTITPFLITKESEMGLVTDDFVVRASYVQSVLSKLNSYDDILKLILRVKIKRVYYTEKPEDGRAAYHDMQERWFVITLNLFKFNIDMNDTENLAANIKKADDIQDINLKNGFKRGTEGAANLRYLLLKLKNLTKDQFRAFLKKLIFDAITSVDHQYDPYDPKNSENNIDENFVLIHDFHYTAKYHDIRGIMEEPHQIMKGVRLFKRTPQSFSKLDPLKKYSEITSNLCLYESLWTAKNDSVMRERQFEGKSIYHLDTRKRCLYDDFSMEREDLKQICITGHWEQFKKIFSRETTGTNIVLVNINTLKPDDEFGLAQRIIIHDGCHAVYASAEKVNEYIKKLPTIYTNAEKKSKRFACKSKKKWDASKDEYININFDIEAYLNEEEQEDRGKFIPYLICTTCDKPEYNKAFWGENSCVSEFISWFKTITRTFEENQGKKKKDRSTKFVFWGFNSAKFDLIFLLPQLAQLPGFIMKGEFTNPKYLEVSGVKFLDFMKLFSGSMKKQQEFWKTTRKKMEMEHNLTKETFSQLSNEQRERIIKYCINDCDVLGEFVSKYKEWISELCVSPYQTSMAALALDVFRTIYASDKWGETIMGCGREDYQFHLNSYFGGYVEVIHMNFPDSLKKYAAEHFTRIRVDMWPNHEIIDQNTQEYRRQGFAEEDIQRAVYGDTPLAEPITEQEQAQCTPAEKMKLIRERGFYPDLSSQCDNQGVYTGKYLRYYDVNSAYPYQMTKEIPVSTKGDIQKLSHPWDITRVNPDQLDDKRLYGVSDLKWDDDTYLPIFPRRTLNGLVYGVNHFGNHVIWGKELKRGMRTGKICQGRITHFQDFNWFPAFKKYIEDFYQKRAKCKEEGDAIGMQIYKLLLNTLYGKFGQKRYPDVQYVNASNINAFMAMHKEDIWDIESYGYSLYQVTMIPDPCEIDNISHCVAVASAVTMSQRDLMREAQERMISKGARIYYCDTDSMITDMDMDQDMTHKTELGKWDLESKIAWGIFAMAKAYTFIDVNLNVVKKFKGFSTERMTATHYLRLLNGMPIKFNCGLLWKREYPKNREERSDGTVVVTPNVKKCFPLLKRIIDPETGETKAPL